MLPIVILAFLPLLSQETSLSQNEQLVLAAKNPYDLARFIDSHLGFDWNVLWKALGTKDEFIQPCGTLSDGKRGCSTELITVLNPDQEILLVQADAAPGLTTVATGKDNSAKSWLKELVNRCKETPEVRQLKALLR